MRLSLCIVMALTLTAQAAERNRAFEAGRDYYMLADFKKAAAFFQVFCNTKDDAEACYWTGMSYERQADVSTPFGCKSDAKAHEYFSKAMKLAPGLPAYRDALFDFLLDTGDCSRKALREAAGMLSAMPESDPDYSVMRSRLEEARHQNASWNERLATLFLIVPRTTSRIAALPAAVVTNKAAERSPR